MMSSMRRARISCFRCCWRRRRRARRNMPAPAHGRAYRSGHASASDVGYAITDWRRLRQSSGYSFADYARFLIANPGWPGEATLRRSAERAMRPGENAGDGPRLLPHRAADERQRLCAAGRRAMPRPARQAEALDRGARGLGVGRPQRRPTSSRSDRALSAAASRAADHDRRVDALLFAKKAERRPPLPAAGQPGAGARRSRRGSRCSRASPTPRRATSAVIGQVTTDAGLMMDRARYLRDSGYEQRRAPACSPGRTISPIARPIPSASTRCMLLLADGAAADRQWQHRLQHRPPGRRRLRRRAADISLKPLGVRDEYTIADLARRDRRARAAQPPGRRDRPCSTAMRAAAARCRSQTKGYYWAGRAALARRAHRRRQRPISSAPRPIPSCSTASWRSSGSAARSPRPAGMPTAAGHRRPARRRSARSGWSARRGCSASRAAATSRPCSSARCPKIARQRRRARRWRSSWRSRSAARTWRCGSPASARNNGSAFYVRQAYPDACGQRPGGRAVVADPRHHPPGKLVRPQRGQPRRRARDDAADAGHRARAGRQDGRRL